MTRFVFKESLQISCKPIKIYSLKLVTFFILGRYLAGTICFNVSSKSLARSRLVQLIATISGSRLNKLQSYSTIQSFRGETEAISIDHLDSRVNIVSHQHN